MDGTATGAQPATPYRFGPLTLLSELELPELAAAPPDSTGHKVHVSLGPVPKFLQGGVEVDPFCWLSPHEMLLHVPGTARYHVAAGALVRIETAPGAHPEDVRIYLLGSVFGNLCYQLGYLPLHASAVLGDSGVVAFAGESGAGKSTLASFLAQRGMPVVSDDICLLEQKATRVAVRPVAGWLKLWRETMDRLGTVPDDAHRVFSRQDKYRVSLAGSQPVETSERYPLSAVVFLDRPDAGSATQPPLLESLAPAAAIVRMMGSVYLPYVSEALGRQADLFRFCGRALSGAGAFRLVAPLGWEQMDATVDLVERQLIRLGSR